MGHARKSLDLLVLSSLMAIVNSGCNSTSFSSNSSSNNAPRLSSSEGGSGETYGLLAQEAAPPVCYSYEAATNPAPAPPKSAGPSAPAESSGASCTSLPKTKVLSRLDVSGNIVVRIIFPKSFVDNTYGKNVIGWGSKGHTFNDLVGSDHVIVTLYDKGGTVVMVTKLDYISQVSGTSQYKSLGVDGGEGKMMAGNRADVIGVRTSLDVNLNDFGYNLITDSPATDTNYAVNSSYSKWIYDVWYDVVVKPSAFAAGGGYGRASLDGIHASPSKIAQNTCPVIPSVCE